MWRSGGSARSAVARAPARPPEDRGAAAVEFALVSLPLFLLIFGIIQYGFVFYEALGAAATAQDGAEWAAEGIEDCDTWHDAVLARAAGFGVTSDLSPAVDADFDLPGSADSTVTVRFTFTPQQLVPLIPVPGTITRTATADVQNIPSGGITTQCP